MNMRVAAIGLIVPCVLHAQDTTRAAPRPVLPPVQITATREGPRPPIELPYAVTVTNPDSPAALKRVGVDELLFAVPGVAVANRQTGAQDPRVSVRGFGARSTFGVRGVRVLQDGIPVTLPDGQTPVDALDIEGADHVEIVRGSASSLYGNAAGGVIDIRSAVPAPMNIAPYARVLGGRATPTVSAFGAGGTIDGVGYTSSLTRVQGPGYRTHSDQRAIRGALRLTTPSSGTTRYALSGRIADVAFAENPGALTRAQFDADPRQADPLSLRKQAGKTVRQGDVALGIDHALSKQGVLSALVYASTRSLDNALTFATVDVSRRSGGASLRASDARTIGSRLMRFTVGGDLQFQHDDRHEWENCTDATRVSTACPAGPSSRGAPRKDQLELVSSIGPFVRAELEVGPRLTASMGLRADAVRFEVRDRLPSPSNANSSGTRTLRAVSPAVGLVWRADLLTSFYVTASGSFETPTMTELVNKPDGSTGLNPDLEPQRTDVLEVGAKGLLPLIGVRWDVAVFDARAHDELVPFDVPGSGGRRYYRNAGRTDRRSAELGLQGDVALLTWQAAYTWSQFRYADYTVGTSSYTGNRMPGVPTHALASAITMRLGESRLSATADMASAIDVDDANSAQAPGRAILGVVLTRTIRAGGIRLEPLVAVQNLAGVRYVSSVSINASGGRFYEPGPGRMLLLRLALARAQPNTP